MKYFVLFASICTCTGKYNAIAIESRVRKRYLRPAFEGTVQALVSGFHKAGITHRRLLLRNYCSLSIWRQTGETSPLIRNYLYFGLGSSRRIFRCWNVHFFDCKTSEVYIRRFFLFCIFSNVLSERAG